MNCQDFPYDVCVVGGGHAGCEAALASARLGLRTLLITGSIDRIAAMSCNPAIGGVGKGHLVKEIDALGGQMARTADLTGIHFRTLNESRGPAVQATRCQSDMEAYRQSMLQTLLATPNLHLRQDDVIGLLSTDAPKAVVGVIGKLSGPVSAKKVILTTGTFLQGQLHMGNEQAPGGRAGEAPARGLSQALRNLGLQLGRLKTGTCPRLDGRTIRFDVLDEQKPDQPAPKFSFEQPESRLGQVSCFITHTNAQTHQAIQEAIREGASPIFNGQIDSKGPRYCPSIEDKVNRFGHKESHLIFLEPHGHGTYEVYPNGLTTSLPPATQIAFLRTIKGLESVEVTRFGYAVEYDFVLPTQLFATLEVKKASGLYCAGQINGTTGYEEAAAQGLIAGINASMALMNRAPLVLKRHEAYLGVLIDDLVTLGTEEPYRMFTSRAEHRLLLREDNVYKRLMHYGRAFGLLCPERHQAMCDFEKAVDQHVDYLSQTRIEGSKINGYLQEIGSAPVAETTTLQALSKRPEIKVAHLLNIENLTGCDSSTPQRVRERALIEEKYAGYIQRAQKSLAAEKELESVSIPNALFESQLSGISNEVHEKLKNIRPATLGQASRIPGITKAAISLLFIQIRNQDLA